MSARRKPPGRRGVPHPGRIPPPGGASHPGEAPRPAAPSGSLPDPAALEAAVEAAARLREALFGRLGEEPRTNAYRMMHGAADGVDGLGVDAMAGRLVVQVERPGALELARRLEPLLVARLAPRSLLRKLRHARGTRGKAPTELVHGEAPPAALEVLEEGVRYELEPLEGLHAGLFTDLREEHVRVRRLAAGRRLLNTFAYTGAFSICGALGGAAATTSVDVVAKPLERARRGLALNGLDPAAHHFARMDVLEFLAMAARRGWRYDAIVLDPPTFGAFRGGTWSAERNYPGLLDAALEVLEHGGLLWAILNTAALDAAWLERRVEAAFAACGRSGRLLAAGGLPPDYPTPLDGSGRYLKALVLEADAPPAARRRAGAEGA